MSSIMNEDKIKKILGLVKEYGSCRQTYVKEDNGMSCKGYSHAAQSAVRSGELILEEIEEELRTAMLTPKELEVLMKGMGYDQPIRSI